MERLSGPDLEVIQKAAGLLGRTVDELLRPLPSPTSTRQRHKSEQSDASSSALQSLNTPTEPDLLAYSTPWHGIEAQSFPFEGDLEQPQAYRLLALEHNDGSRVILLNPRTAQYACNSDYMDYDASTTYTGDNSFPEMFGYSDTNDNNLVQITPPGTDSDADSESSAAMVEKQNDGTGTEWSLFSVSSEPAFVDTMSRDRSPPSKPSYSLIAPKPRRDPSDQYSIRSGNSQKVRKRRAHYQTAKRHETMLTRSINSCVRCKMQRNRCIPDPVNPFGPCQPCQKKKTRMSRLPCLRYRLTETKLFRTGLDYMEFYKVHPMEGPRYGDFHLQRQWTGSASKWLSLCHEGGAYFQLELKEFVAPSEETAKDLKGRSMYAVPWAIANPEVAITAINAYITENIGTYLESRLDDSDHLVFDIFHLAYRASIFPVPNDLLRKVIRLWVVCRFIESKWQCWGDEDITKANPQDPFHNVASPPPYLDYQFASIIIQRILIPLREELLRDLQNLVCEHKPEDWFITFLACFILLHNYELQMEFQLQFAARRKATVRYLDMPLVRATNQGAKIILAHFHYCCKGQKPFDEDFDWQSPASRRMAHVDDEQAEFLTRYRERVAQKAETMNKINHTDNYHERYWYTSQLFDPNWVPRETLEHAPKASPPAE